MHFQAVAKRAAWGGILGSLLFASPIQAAADPLPISLEETYRGGLAAALKSQVAGEQIHENEALVRQSEAAFLPTLKFTSSQQNLTANLAAEGLTGTGLPIGPRVGPFYSFDARIRLVYTILDAQSRWKGKSAKAGLRAAVAQLLLEQQEAGANAALAYLQLIATLHTRSNVAADVTAAQETLKVAVDQKAAGVAAGIDVTRAENEVVAQKLRQQQAEKNVSSANLKLSRALGQPLAQTFQPREEMVPRLNQAYTVETALQQAIARRVEFQVLASQQQQFEAEISAARAEMSPTAGLSADYGFSGNTPGSNDYGTHTVGLTISIPLFDGGLSDAKVDVQKSQLQQLKLRYRDQVAQTEQDVRAALLEIELAQSQSVSAASGLRLAEAELTMARDRFRAGFTNSLEVTNAQASLARARESEAQARSNTSQAVLQLAVAMGTPESLSEQAMPTNKPGGNHDR